MAWLPKPATPKYRTTNWSEYNAALKRRRSLEIWFDPGMAWLATADSRPGRPHRFSDSAIELCLTLKVLIELALRKITGLVASLPKLAKLDSPVPDYTTLCRRQKYWKSRLAGVPVQALSICGSIAQVSRLWAKGNGKPASMAPRAVGNGDKCTWG